MFVAQQTYKLFWVLVYVEDSQSSFISFVPKIVFPSKAVTQKRMALLTSAAPVVMLALLMLSVYVTLCFSGSSPKRLLLAEILSPPSFSGGRSTKNGIFSQARCGMSHLSYNQNSGKAISPSVQQSVSTSKKMFYFILHSHPITLG